MATTNYDIPTIDGSAAIDIAGDVNAALNAIDNVIKDDTAKMQNEIVIIGDSFSDTTARQNLWPTLIPANYVVHNFAKSGAGFVSGSGGTFMSQADQAVAQITDVQPVKTVIVYGGINDLGASVSATDEAAAIIQLYNKLASHFTYSNIAIAFTNAGFVTRSGQEDINNWTSDIYQMIQSAAVPMFNAQYWLFGFATNDVFSDGLHPNARGSQIIATLMMQIVNGCYNPGSMWFNTSYTANNSTFTANWNPNGDLYFIGDIKQLNFSASGSVTLTSSANNRWQRWASISNIAIPCRPSDAHVISVYMNVATNTIYWFTDGAGASNGTLYF